MNADQETNRNCVVVYMTKSIFGIICVYFW